MSFCCCCPRGNKNSYSKPSHLSNSTINTSGYYHNDNHHEDTASPPLLAPSNSGHHHHHSPYTPSSPRAIRGRPSTSANEYVSHVVNLCRIGSGSFAVVSLVIDKKVLNNLKDNDSALPAFFAVKRISKRHEASRLAPGEGGAHAERHTHAILEHPFFPVLYNACRSNRDFYIAFPFALGADVSKALARRANTMRGFGKEQAAALHAQATANGTLQGMKDLIGNSGPDSLGQHQTNTLMMIANNSNKNNSNGMGRKSRSGSENENTNSSNNNGNSQNVSKRTLNSNESSNSTNSSRNNSPRGNSNSKSSSSLSSISEIRATNYGLPISFVCLVAYELLSAIAFLNEKGYTHYDIRPGNLLLVHGGHVILGDFGMIRDESGMRGDSMNNLNSPNSNNNNNSSSDQGTFSKFFSSIMGGKSNNNSFSASGGGGSGFYSNNPNNNASFHNNNNNASFQHNNNNGSGSPRGMNGSGHHETSNEKRSQLYLAPEHLSTASNIEAENDCKRLSDVWSYGVLLMELALGAHPFTPQNGQDSSAYAMLASIKRMQFRKIPTNGIQNETVASVVDLLNDLCATIFVARDSRPSAMSLMQHPFFKSPQVRALVGIKEGTSEIALPSPQFFGKVVNAKKLLGPASLDPARVCLKGGCPTAKELREWLAVLAPIPQTAAAEDFAPTLDIEAIYEDDSRELIDLRFFGSLSEDDLAKWSIDDNENCLRSYDSEWCPEDMGCNRAGGISSHGSNLGGGGGNNDHHHHRGHQRTNSKNARGEYGAGGGGYYHDDEYGRNESGFAMQDQPGFTFVRPNSHLV